jgi:hypothetical protein
VKGRCGIFFGETDLCRRKRHQSFLQLQLQLLEIFLASESVDFLLAE